MYIIFQQTSISPQWGKTGGKQIVSKSYESYIKVFKLKFS
jgi:hypothetical protein